MSEHTAIVEWSREGATFTDNRYSRGHRWRFDGGVEVDGVVVAAFRARPAFGRGRGGSRGGLRRQPVELSHALVPDAGGPGAGS